MIKKIFIFLLLSLALLPSAASLAVTQPCEGDSTRQCTVLENPLATGTTDIKVVIGTVIKAALGLIGSITLFMFIWGANKWLLSAGNAEKIKEGTQTMLWAGLGVLVVFVSYIFISNITFFLSGKK